MEPKKYRLLFRAYVAYTATGVTLITTDATIDTSVPSIGTF